MKDFELICLSFLVNADSNGNFLAKFEQKCSIFSHKTKVSYFRRSTLSKNWIKVSLNPLNLGANFLLKFLFGEIHSC